MLEVFVNNINAILCLKVHFFKEFLRYLFSDEILYVFLFSKTNTLFWFIFTWFFAIFLHLKTKVWVLNWKKLYCSNNTLQKQSNILQSIAKCVKLFCSILQKSIELYKNFEMVWFSQITQTFCKITQKFWEMMPKSCNDSIIFCKVI